MRRFSAACLLAMILVGCGQSGPLYLPGDPSEVRTTPPSEPENEPGKEPDEPKKNNGKDPKG